MPATSKTVNMQVPQYMLEDLQQYMNQLQSIPGTDHEFVPEVVPGPDPEPDVNVSQTLEVSRIKCHKISKDGSWSFLILFKDGSQEWIPDNMCNCSQKISEYLKTKNIRTYHLVCRVSTKEQASSTSTSLDTQEIDLRTRCGHGNKNLRIKVYKISESAYKGIPKTLATIGTTALSGDTIYVWRVDRLSRNIIAYLSWLEDLNFRGVNIVAHSECLEYDTNKLGFIQGVVEAQKEAELLGKRIKKSYEHKKARGDERVGGLPYGKIYHSIMNDNGSQVAYKVVVDNTQEVLNIRRIKDSKDHPDILAKKFNREGITKRGRKWNMQMVKRIMSNI